MVGISKDKGDINLICKFLCVQLTCLQYPRCYIIVTLAVTIFTLQSRSCEKSICESVAELHLQMKSLPIFSQRSISLCLIIRQLWTYKYDRTLCWSSPTGTAEAEQVHVRDESASSGTDWIVGQVLRLVLVPATRCYRATTTHSTVCPLIRNDTKRSWKWNSVFADHLLERKSPAPFVFHRQSTTNSDCKSRHS